MQGLKIGFEIHQQLDTHKLFCDCPSLLREDKTHVTIERRLRPTQSELGEIDRAALDEFLKGKSFIYETYPDTTCLVELDEEPPHMPNEEAIDIALGLAMRLNARVVEEIHFMRKLVIDGSNTSGFQRTAIVAFDGCLKTDEGKVNIPTICLEEEAARKIVEKEKKTVYRLDRLGIPLIEITTAPDIKTPKQARDVALEMGKILRDFKVKRGIGTIRQDLNVSIKGGARVEIKGVQDLNQIPKLIENEVERQEKLIGLKEELKKRGMSEKDLDPHVYDVSAIFQNSRSKVIANQLKKGGKVLALKLTGFKGLLGSPLCALPQAKRKIERLGPEFAQYAKASAGVQGIFHIDELPTYGISQAEVDNVIKKLNLKEKDAFVLVAEKKEIAEKALEAVFKRAKMAFSGVPNETRVANIDGSTAYMRPLPGAARMYPETDIPPVAISKERLRVIKENLPESYADKKKRYIKQGLSEEMASQLVASSASFKFGIKKEKLPLWQLYEEAIDSVDISPNIVANTLLGTLKDLKREGYKTEEIPGEKLIEIFRMTAEGKIAKEAIPEVLKRMAEAPKKTAAEAAEDLGLTGFGEREVTEIVNKILKNKAEFIKEKGLDSAKPLMGLVMKEVRGRVDGKLVNELLQRELKKFLGKP
jgi:glutamyl-tRNA(Gln) amidotransferase subunit E